MRCWSLGCGRALGRCRLVRSGVAEALVCERTFPGGAALGRRWARIVIITHRCNLSRRRLSVTRHSDAGVNRLSTKLEPYYW